MRHFVILGFKTPHNSEQGEQVHIGTDRGKAIDLVNTPDDRFARKELYELATPHIRRQLPSPAHQVATRATKAKTPKK